MPASGKLKLRNSDANSEHKSSIQKTKTFKIKLELNERKLGIEYCIPLLINVQFYSHLLLLYALNLFVLLSFVQFTIKNTRLLRSTCARIAALLDMA
jgi:hypothetical protein